MKPKNSVERRNAFIRFVIFYALTTALIITAVFFSFQVPFKENRQLRSQLSVVYKEREFDRSFFNLTNETKKMLDSIDRFPAGADVSLLEGRITGNIQKMDAMASRDSVSRTRIYSVLVTTFSNANADKKRIRVASSKGDIEAVYKERENEIRKSLDEYRKAFEELKDRYMQLQNAQ
jgi:hypothetical protein